MSVQEAIKSLVEGRSLSGPQAAAALEEIMQGNATPAQVGAFLTALRMSGETPEILAACLDVTERHAERVPVGNVIDVVGTGGDGLDTFNVSTAAAITLAGAGLRVAKHGNRAASSKCGSADVLEALGANLDISGERAAAIIEDCGFCFLFAQRYHPAFRHVGPPRREVGIRTIFNALGPLSNPARPRAMLVGVGASSLGPLVADAFRIRGLASFKIIHSAEGLDEVSPAGPTTTWELEGGAVVQRQIDPASFGLPAHPLSDVLGGSPAENADAMRALFDGKQGPVLDFVLANAALGALVAGAVADLPSGVALARESIASGRARSVLERYIALTQVPANG